MLAFGVFYINNPYKHIKVEKTIPNAKHLLGILSSSEHKHIQGKIFTVLWRSVNWLVSVFDKID